MMTNCIGDFFPGSRIRFVRDLNFQGDRLLQLSGKYIIDNSILRILGEFSFSDR